MGNEPSQIFPQVLTPPATDADTMPPQLPTESQLAQETKSPSRITGPDDETEDEEQDPVILPTPGRRPQRPILGNAELSSVGLFCRPCHYGHHESPHFLAL